MTHGINENWVGDGWNLRQVDTQQVIDNEGGLQIGDYCFSPMPTDIEEWEGLGHAPWPFHMVKPYKLSDFYFTNNIGRKPIVVLMPGRDWFCLDCKCVNDGKYEGGWSVVGDPTKGTLTVHPSINMIGRYHGWLRNNKISADCEGRRYDPITGYQLA